MGQKRRVSEDYENDGGFIDDAPRSKKSKAVPKSSSASLEKQQDDDGNVYWEISRTRRVQVSDFKGATMVGIREFYEKDGKMLPGKKGISLSLDQFNAVIELLPQLESELKTKGHNLPRPAYSSETASAPDDTSDADEEVDEEEDGVAEEKSQVSKSAKARINKSAHKGNHEATSDEDNG